MDMQEQLGPMDRNINQVPFVLGGHAEPDDQVVPIPTGQVCPKGDKVADKEPFGYQKPALNDHELAAKLDRVDELVSLLLDDELEADSFGELEGLLVESPEARSQYIGLVQLHTDLLEFYNPGAFAVENIPSLAHLTQTVDGAPPTPPEANN